MLVARRILTTLVFLAILSGQLSESQGNIVGFPGVSNQSEVFGLDATTNYFQQTISAQQTTADAGTQSAPLPAQPFLPQPKERPEWWLAVCPSMSSPESFQSSSGAAGQASLVAYYKFFLGQPLSWTCCGEKLIFPETPIESLLKIPIC